MSHPASSSLPVAARLSPAAPLAQLVRDAWSNGPERLRLAGAAGCLTLVGFAYWSTLHHFIHVWSTDENYSHGFLVPFISLYFANEAAKRGPTEIRGGVGLGITLLVVAILLRLATIVVPIGILADCAFLLALAGACGLLFGSAVLARYGFALFFLVFMVPLPVALYTRIASPLQILVSQAASALLNGVGIPVYREGNLMTLPGGVSMFVAEACSGIRQLTGFLALTTAVAYMVARPLWYRLALIVSSIPVALGANVTRVFLTGIIMYKIDPEYAAGTYHTLEGLLLMGFGLAILGAECSLLNLACRAGRAEEGSATPVEPERRNLL
jgi:exosortase